MHWCAVCCEKCSHILFFSIFSHSVGISSILWYKSSSAEPIAPLALAQCQRQQSEKKQKLQKKKYNLENWIECCWVYVFFLFAAVIFDKKAATTTKEKPQWWLANFTLIQSFVPVIQAEIFRNSHAQNHNCTTACMLAYNIEHTDTVASKINPTDFTDRATLKAYRYVHTTTFIFPLPMDIDQNDFLL